MRSRFRMNLMLPLVLALALGAVACDLSAVPGSLFPPQPAPSAQSAPTTEITLPPTQPPATPTHTPTTPVTVQDSACVPAGSSDPLAETSYEDYPNEFLRFLNSGGALSALQANLDALGIANLPPAVASTDLTGDGKNDVVVSFLQPDPQTVPAPGALLIYTCLRGQYILTHIELAREFQGAPRILALQDMNGDAAAEVIASSSTCGAHTCFESAMILSWDGSRFENRLEGSTENMPYPDLQITDYDRDGLYDLEVTGRGFGSVGAGPQRSITRIWSYQVDRGLWALGAEILGASQYRIHTLHDADAAARRGDYQVAAVLYQQVIQNDSLLDWMDQDNERLNLSAFATYKLVVVHVFTGDLAQAQTVMAQFRQGTSPASPQYPYLLLAEAFLNSSAVSLDQACSAARTYAGQYPQQILAPLGSQVFGYANPDYTPEDICP